MQLYLDSNLVQQLAKVLKHNVDRYFHMQDGVDTVLAQETLAELGSLFEKLLWSAEFRKLCVAHEVHHSLVRLLSASEPTLLRIALMGMVRLVKSAGPDNDVGGYQCIKMLLQFLEDDYPTDLKRLAAEVLSRLTQGSANTAARKQTRVLDGVRCIVGQLQSVDPRLLLQVTGILEWLARDAEGQSEIRKCGGIGALLMHLHPDKHPGPISPRRPRLSNFGGETDPRSSAEQVASPGILHRVFSPTPRPPPLRAGEQVMDAQRFEFFARICATLTQLSSSDLNASLIRENNGIFLLSSLLLPPLPLGGVEPGATAAVEALQVNVFRSLRFLFSVERNRRMFRRLFPAVLFERFLQVPHYCHDLAQYAPLIECLQSLPAKRMEQFGACIGETDFFREPERYVKDYGILETIGSGAFGTVYRVQLRPEQRSGRAQSLAMKEILVKSSAFGSTSKEQTQSLSSIVNEARILEIMDHPNVVRYHRSFADNDRIYLVMELVEGADLLEVVESFTEKGMQFTEKRLWSIFVQMCTALSYLHKKLNVVHRDIKPANIRLDFNDRIKIIDFGLAKQKLSESSLMQSTCGTLQYSCPEVIQGKAYCSKADVWALGCVMYQLATLKPPFDSKNMLTLAKRIVEANYSPIPDRSELFTATVNRCMVADLDMRPDITEVCQLIAPELIKEIDRLNLVTTSHTNELEIERGQRRRHQTESERHKQTIHTMHASTMLQNQNQSQPPAVQRARVARRVSSSTSPNIATVPEDGGSLRGSIASPSKLLMDASLSSDSGEGPRSSPQSVDSLGASFQSSLFWGSHLPPHILASLDTPPPRRSQSGLPVDSSPGSFSGDPFDGLPMSPTARPTARVRDYEGILSRVQRARSKSVQDLEGVPGLPGMAPAARRRSLSTRSARPMSGLGRTLKVAASEVRPCDPITVLLNQLHKIVFISQLPPDFAATDDTERGRFIIERYKRALFRRQAGSVDLKQELKMLSAGSKKLIQMDLGIIPREQEWLEAFPGETPDPGSTESEQLQRDNQGVTYSRMHKLVEMVLHGSGYYDLKVPTAVGGMGAGLNDPGPGGDAAVRGV